jgi:hypothetical protein
MKSTDYLETRLQTITATHGVINLCKTLLDMHLDSIHDGHEPLTHAMVGGVRDALTIVNDAIYRSTYEIAEHCKVEQHEMPGTIFTREGEFPCK